MSRKLSLIAAMLGGLFMVGLLTLALNGAQPVTAQAPFEVVATGLNNPRGLEFGPDGALYVAEAGVGGAGPCIIGPEGLVCYGESGGVTRWTSTSQTRIVSDMVSLATVTGTSGIGPHDVTFDTMGEMYVVVGLGADPAIRTISLGVGGPNFGQLVHVAGDGTWTNVADVAAYEAANNPNNDDVDSNPYAVLARNDGFAVIDAGGNSLLHVAGPVAAAPAAGGWPISTIATFPSRTVEFPPGMDFPMQAVPTTLLPDGPDDFLVGQLTGFPFPPGGANIYHVVSGMTPTVYMTGFTNIIDMTTDPDGNMYVLEIATNGLLAGPPGALFKIAPDGTKTQLASNGLVFPTGVTYGPDGWLYISNFGVFPGSYGEGNGGPTGQVIRLDPNGPTDVSLSQFGGADGRSSIWPLLLAIVALTTPMLALRLWRRRRVVL